MCTCKYVHGPCITWVDSSLSCMMIWNVFFRAVFCVCFFQDTCDTCRIVLLLLCVVKSVLLQSLLWLKRVDLWARCDFIPRHDNNNKQQGKWAKFSILNIPLGNLEQQTSSADLLTQEELLLFLWILDPNQSESRYFCAEDHTVVKQNPWLIPRIPSLTTLAARLSRQLKTYSDDVNECCFSRVLKTNQRQLHLLLPKQRPEPVQKPVY